MTWVIGINTWKKVEHFYCKQRGGTLFRSNEYPNQWKWRENIVFADSLDESREKFAQQYRADCDYWERIGNGHFMWVVGFYRGGIYRHRGDKTLWRFKDYAFHADTESEAYELLLERFGKQETA